MILIPVKNLAQAKQRLAPVLDQGSRTKLAQAMLVDIFETLDSWDARPDISVVSSDALAVDLAHRFGFGVIPDNGSGSETAAIEMATRWCEEQGAGFSLVIPGDVPLISIRELETILESAPVEGAVLVPSADGRGTNAVLRTPPALFPLRFGNDSFLQHIAAAKATGEKCVALSLPGFALDIDTPADLQALAAAPGESRSQRLAREFNFLEFPVAANI